jgi:hypothetical protein
MYSPRQDQCTYDCRHFNGYVTASFSLVSKHRVTTYKIRCDADFKSCTLKVDSEIKGGPEAETSMALMNYGHEDENYLADFGGDFGVDKS